MYYIILFLFIESIINPVSYTHLNVKINKAIIDYPLLYETKEIYLSEKDEEILETVLKEIVLIKHMSVPPKNEKKKICKKCAYYDMCMI